jgi:dienelactone hydrolase
MSCARKKSWAGTIRMLAQTMTEDYISQVGAVHLKARRERLGAIASPEAAAARQTEIRRICAEILGEFPTRTPLNIRSIKTIQRDGYIIEILTYQSLPGVVTTANLYRPKDQSEHSPGVVCIPGHWQEGKVHAEYQRLAQLLARRGIVALVFDLVGQGERLEFYDPTLRRSWLGKKVDVEQTHLGNLLLLTGHHLGNWMLWDAIRGIDLLIEHAGVDAARIGATGVASGGGLTRMLGCLEPRLQAAVTVADYYDLNGLGGEDVELNLPGGLARGITASDLCVPFAPKPLLLASSTVDRATEKMTANLAELSHWYGLLGSKEKLTSFQADGPHGYLKETRARAVEHFASAFDMPNEVVREPATPPESPETLYCTETGQVSNSLRAVSVFSYHKQRAADLPPAVSVPRDVDSARGVQAELRGKFTTYLRLPPCNKPIENKVESHSNDYGFLVEKGRLLVDESIYVPYSFYTRPEGAASLASVRSSPTALVLHDRGIAAISSESAWMAGFAAAGFHVMAIDVMGVGETRLGSKADDSEAYETLLRGPESLWARRALNVGISLFGLRVCNVLRTLEYLRSRSEVDHKSISIVGVGRGGLWGLYASALAEKSDAEDGVARLAMVRTLASYRCLVERRRHNHHFSIYLPGCLKDFDLPHVAACVAPRKLTMINPVDPRKERCDPDRLQRDYALTQAIYKATGAANGFRACFTDSGPDTVAAVIDAIK